MFNPIPMTLSLLAISGLLGILVHNFMKIDALNRANPDKFNLLSFWKVEWASIALSVCFLIAMLIARTQIQELERVGKWLSVGFFCIGLCAQSIAYYLKNRTESEVKVPQ